MSNMLLEKMVAIAKNLEATDIVVADLRVEFCYAYQVCSMSIYKDLFHFTVCHPKSNYASIHASKGWIRKGRLLTLKSEDSVQKNADIIRNGLKWDELYSAKNILLQTSIAHENELRKHKADLIEQSGMKSEKYPSNLVGLALIDIDLLIKGVVYHGKHNEDGILVTADGKVCQEFKYLPGKNYKSCDRKVVPTPVQQFAKYIFECANC